MALYGRDWKQRFLMHSTNKMATQHKPKRVSWASEGNLCQVRLFLSEDPPTHAGSGAQDLLQAKASWLWHSTGTGDELPPGFETSQPMWHPKGLSSVKWRYPPRFMINPSWKVAAGEESREVEVQNQRQFKVLEAVYPRPSSIPPSPSEPSEPEEEPNSHHPPLIPITPIEDEDPSEHLEAPPSTNTNFENPSLLESLPTSTGVDIRPPIEPAECNDLSSGIKLSSDGKPISMSGTRGTEPDVAAAASAAFTAILKSKEEGSLIDPDLLIRILSNPKLIEKFLTEHGKGGAPVSHANLKNPTIIPMIQPPTTSKPLPPVQTSPATFPAKSLDSHAPVAGIPDFQPPGFPPPTHGVTTSSPIPIKDASYYKSLIKQHGGEKPIDLSLDQVPLQYGRHHSQMHFSGGYDMMQSSRLRDLKPKIAKPCLYYHSPKGCRNGVNCSYLHEGEMSRPLGGVSEMPGPKRMKFESEIAGR